MINFDFTVSYIIDIINHYHNIFIIKSSQFMCKYIYIKYYKAKAIVELSMFITTILMLTIIIFIVAHVYGIIKILENNKVFKEIDDILIANSLYVNIVLFAMLIYMSYTMYTIILTYIDANDVFNDFKILNKCNKNTLDLSYMYSPIKNYSLKIHMSEIIDILLSSKAHTIILYDWHLSKSELYKFHDKLFCKNKYINHIYFNKKDYKNSKKHLKCIKKMKCKYANLIYILLLQQKCKNEFKVSKDIIKYKIIPLLKFK